MLAGRYRVLKRLGAGGMAVVFLAEDERLGRQVAVKRLHAEGTDDGALRFEREAKVGASLNHPNIVAVYDTVADDEGILIVMEYVEGPTLRTELDRGRLDPARAIEVLSGVAAALDHAHEHGVVHRDVKPANVLLAERTGAVKLADLGIATAAERTRITHSGVVLGTASYMAPERLDGQAGGPAADVYALAAVAYEALSGQKAVTGRSALEVAQRVMNDPPPDLAAATPDAPAAAADALRRGLAREPADRQATAGELVRELSAAYAGAVEGRTGPTRALAGAAAVEPPLQQPPVEQPPPPDTAPRRRPPTAAPAPARRRPAWLVPAALVATAAIVAALILAVALDSGGDTNSNSSSKSAGTKTNTTRSTPTQQTTTGDTATTPEQTTPATPATPADEPSTTVRDFYTRAAEDDYEGAWALGSDGLHQQFGSIERLRGTFSTLESIEFDQLSTTDQAGETATVAFSTQATHTDRNEACTGEATLTQTGSKWLIDHIGGVTCKTTKAQGKKPKKPKKKG